MNNYYNDHYELQVCGLSRTLPLIPLGETHVFASFVPLGATELISVAAQKLPLFQKTENGYVAVE